MKPQEINIETLETPDAMNIWAQGDRTIFLNALPDLGPDQAPTAPVPVQWLLHLMADEITCREIIARLYTCFGLGRLGNPTDEEYKACHLLQDYKAKLHQIQADIARINLHNTKYQIVRQSSLIHMAAPAPSGGRLI